MLLLKDYKWFISITSIQKKVIQVKKKILVSVLKCAI